MTITALLGTVYFGMRCPLPHFETKNPERRAVLLFLLGFQMKTVPAG